MSDTGGDEAPRALVATLERVLEEREALIVRLAGMAPGEDAEEVRCRLTRLTRLTREQVRLLDELAALLPPDDAGAGGRT